MNIRWCRFNIYLVLALAWAAVCGCKTANLIHPKPLLATFRLHLEASRAGIEGHEPVPIYREKPVMVNVQKEPLLAEGNIARASVIDVVGGFALRIQFDKPGTGLFEQYTTANLGRRIAVFCQFGKDLQNARWLAAPIITHRIADGVFTFTPDANREECEEIALGLNNVAKKVQAWPDF
jgi:hypothetical protein